MPSKKRRRRLLLIAAARRKYPQLKKIKRPTFYRALKNTFYSECAPPFTRKTRICVGFYDEEGKFNPCHKTDLADCRQSCPVRFEAKPV